jgi:hypothetical protein
MATHIYRYQFTTGTLDLTAVNRVISPSFPVSVSHAWEAPFVDVSADDSTKGDLDYIMGQLGWTFVSTDPTTPAVGSATQYTYVLMPGAPQAGNVYPDSNSLFAAVLAQRAITGDASNILIEVNGSLAPATWLANGSQDMSGVTLFSSQQTVQGFTLTLADNVIWTFDTLLVDGLSLLSQGGTSPVTQATTATLVLDNFSQVASKGVASFFVLSGVLEGLFKGNSTLGDFVHHAVKVTGAGGNFTGYFYQNSAIGSHAFDPTGTSNIAFNIDASVFAATQDAPLTPSINFLDASGQMSYTATNVADWSGTNPSSIQNALDRIAAKITPIP